MQRISGENTGTGGTPKDPSRTQAGRRDVGLFMPEPLAENQNGSGQSGHGHQAQPQAHSGFVSGVGAVGAVIAGIAAAVGVGIGGAADGTLAVLVAVAGGGDDLAGLDGLAADGADLIAG